MKSFGQKILRVAIAALAFGTAFPCAHAQGGSAAMTPPNLERAAHLLAIAPDDVARFWDKWHLVTVRFRKDNGEQRFVYANDVAWRAMTTNARPYPDGSLIGKIAFRTEDDPRFPNSVVPGSSVRVQLMKKDRKLFPTTDGWGYALFNAGTETIDSETPATKRAELTAACHSCHTIVKDLDFVFAKPLPIFGVATNAPASTPLPLKARFIERDPSSLAPADQKMLAQIKDPPKTPLHVLQMPLFLGSLHESAGPVGSFAATDRAAYVLSDPAANFMLVAIPDAAGKDCGSAARLYRIERNSAPCPNAEREYVIHEGRFCKGAATWTPSSP